MANSVSPEVIQQAQKEAYNLMVESLDDVVLESLDGFYDHYVHMGFSDETLDLIHREEEADPMSNILYDILDPAIEEIKLRIRKSLYVHKFED